MCMLCNEWEKKKITAKEALNAMREMIQDPAQTDHLMELSERILNAEVPSGTESDPDLDAEWERKHYGSD